MPYIGKSPTQAVRARYYYTVASGATSVTGSDDNSNTLIFSDGEFVDVSLNGVTLVAGTDYVTTTANTIGSLSAMSANDVVEVVVYDVFSVFDGNVNSDFSIGGTLNVASGAVFNEDSADVDFRVESNGNANMLFVDGGNDKVGIATATPVVPLTVKGTQEQLTLTAGANKGATFDYNTSTGSLNIATNGVNARSATQLSLDLNGNIDVGTGDIFFSTAGKGIVLGATSNTDANTLDDYEEGTFTPTITGSSSNPSVTYITQAGKYTKVGNLVTVSIYLETSAFSGGGGDLQFSGLPFTSVNVTASPSQGAISFFKVNSHNAENSAYVGANSSIVKVLGRSGSAASDTWSSLAISAWTNANPTAASMSVTYFT